MRDKKGSEETERSAAGWKRYISEGRDVWVDCANNRHVNEAI